MTSEQIKIYILEKYPKENESCEHKKFSNLKHSVSGNAGEDIISYVSAISNMEGGALVLGVEDGSLNIEGIQNFHDYTKENFPHRIAGNCTNLPLLGLKVEELKTTDTAATIWILHIPKHFPRTPVIAHKKAWQRIGDNLVELTEQRRSQILHEQTGHDWSMQIIPNASLQDLDTNAINTARNQFKQKDLKFATEVDSWSDGIFLDKIKATINGQITRTALLLFGKPESVHYLSPNPAQITWKLETAEEKSYEHFTPPFIVTTTNILNRIRNVRIKLFPESQLLPIEIQKYETRVILEALHNCIAHQNYEMNERIILTEKADRLIFENAGEFYDGNFQKYATGLQTPKGYRNHWLASAMVSVGMIDTMGYGIREMFLQQRNRFLPLPDYSKSDHNHVVLAIHGQVIDQRYSRLLQSNPDLSLDLVMGIDSVQKKQHIDDTLAKQLKQSKLIEGRKPNYFISANVAAKTNQRANYTRNKGLDDNFYKGLVLEHLKQFGSSTKKDLEEFLLPKLPEIMTTEQKKHKVKNLLSSMRMKDKSVKADRSGPGANWSLSTNEVLKKS